MKKISKLVLALILCVSLVGCTNGNDDTKIGYKAGTYESSAKGMNGDVEVEVVVSDEKIESVTILSHNETPNVSDLALKQIPAKIVEFQGLGIDVISGATLTSDAVLLATEQALIEAGGDVDQP